MTYEIINHTFNKYECILYYYKWLSLYSLLASHFFGASVSVSGCLTQASHKNSLKEWYLCLTHTPNSSIRLKTSFFSETLNEKPLSEVFILSIPRHIFSLISKSFIFYNITINNFTKVIFVKQNNVRYKMIGRVRSIWFSLSM